ncbi:MAG: hypothetical protein J0H02_12765 [Armatimonadetes bacterium]|nr:hypothetical protein [Armatimonadota bacterium]
MEGLLNRAADGSSKGLARWYALAHAAHCSGCKKFLDNLTRMIEQMRREKQPPVDQGAVDRLTALVREVGAVESATEQG